MADGVKGAKASVLGQRTTSAAAKKGENCTMVMESKMLNLYLSSQNSMSARSVSNERAGVLNGCTGVQKSCDINTLSHTTIVSIA